MDVHVAIRVRAEDGRGASGRGVRNPPGVEEMGQGYGPFLVRYFQSSLLNLMRHLYFNKQFKEIV